MNLKRLYMENDLDTLTSFISDIRDYYDMIQERSEARELASEIFCEMPPDFPSECKIVYGIFDSGRMIAVLEGLRGYPDEDTFYLGFFAVSDNYRRKGTGKSIMQLFENSCTQSHIRLGVIEENTSGRAFWENLGFKPVKIVEDYKSGAITTQVTVMQKDVSKK